MPTLLINGRTSALPTGAPAPQGGPWAPLEHLEALSGWAIKPEGACLGDLCVPLNDDLRARATRDGWFDLGALAEHLSQPVAFDAPTQTWSIGEAAIDRNTALESLEAPDFRLPDHLGKEHQLSDYRGKKVFLASWASW